MSKPASKSATKAAPPEHPEFAVRREGFNRIFDKPECPVVIRPRVDALSPKTRGLAYDLMVD